MVAPATGAHRGLLERAQPGRGLAGVPHAKRAGALDELVHTRGDAAQVPEAESVAAVARSVRPQRRVADVEKKDAATPKRRKASASAKRSKGTTPAEFVRQSVDELKKVIWPTGLQVRQYFVVVLVFVLFIIAYVGLLDLGFGALLLRLLG